MVKIRLDKVRSKNYPQFRIVAIDERRKKGGKSLEILGFWNLTKATKKIDNPRLDFWITRGAQTTKAVKNLLGKKA